MCLYSYSAYALNSSLVVCIYSGPRGFWDLGRMAIPFLGAGENGYSFSGSWGALVIISEDLGSKLIVLGI